METVSQPCLATQEVVSLARLKPSNIWIQGLVIEAGRTSRNDIQPALAGITMLDVRQSYPNFYIPTQELRFNTPLMKDPSDYLWDDFVKQILAADKHILEYDYNGKKHTDAPLSDRLFIKELLLLECPRDDKRYRDDAPGNHYNPANQDDEFYDGMPCTYATFAGTHQLLGARSMRDGILPGAVRKPMHLVELERVPTKHIKRIDKFALMRAFIRTRNKKDVIKLDELLSMNRRDCEATVRRYLPTCYQTEIVKQLTIEGDWENLRRLRCSTISLDALTKD
jgi:hypothetical protein